MVHVCWCVQVCLFVCLFTQVGPWGTHVLFHGKSTERSKLILQSSQCGLHDRRMLSQVETFKTCTITTDFKYLLKSNQIAMLNSVTSKLKTFRSSTFYAQCRKKDRNLHLIHQKTLISSMHMMCHRTRLITIVRVKIVKKQVLTHEIYHNKPSQEKNYISIIRKGLKESTIY